MGPQLADRLVTIDGPDGAAFAVPASPSAADAGAPAVSVVKKKLFGLVPFECSGEVPTGTDGSGLAACGQGVDDAADNLPA